LASSDLDNVVGGIFALVIVTVFVGATDPALQTALAQAASTTPGPVSLLFQALYYLHGASVFIELVGLLGSIGVMRN
jgi:hypothetical protein